jgi:L,D-peptidoglycan transpeptidase YkuD (ErfK/YbiS/YcfS/YnhG family)
VGVHIRHRRLSPARTAVTAVAAVAALTLAALTAAAGAAPAARAATAPAPAQVITVSAAKYTSTYATLRAYKVVHGKWTLVYGPWQARVGYNGVARAGQKREGDGKTPSGRYGFSFMFGVDANPGVHYSWRHAFPYDVWDDDPASPRYNEWINTHKHDAGAAPEPMHQVPAYDYGAVIGYNTARTPGLGSAIFLHAGTGSATAGCVSLPKAELLRVLRWLRPAAHPQIRISVR